VKTNSGNDMQSRQMGGDVMGAGGTSTGTTATSLTDTGQAWGVNAFTGHIVATAGAAGVYGVVVSNTATVLTIDRWNTPATPGSTAGATPGAATAYVILPGNAPAEFMALTANATAPAATDTALTGEIVTAGGGLIRKICPYAHTAGAASYTLTPVFTANATDALPVTVAKIGVFQSVVGASGNLLFETLLGTTATLSANGDQLTITETVTL
jgi:hypothetical protein